MPMIAPPLLVKAGDKDKLEAFLRASSVSLVLRMRIVLLAPVFHDDPGTMINTAR